MEVRDLIFELNRVPGKDVPVRVLDIDEEKPRDIDFVELDPDGGVRIVLAERGD